MNIKPPIQTSLAKGPVKIASPPTPKSSNGSPVAKDWFDQAENFLETKNPLKNKALVLTGAALSGAIPMGGFVSNLTALKRIGRSESTELRRLSNLTTVAGLANLPANLLGIMALVENNTPLAIASMGFSVASTTLAWAVSEELAGREGA